MTIKKCCQTLLLSICFILIQSSHAQNSLGQTLQINTRFVTVYGKPEWLVIIREMETGRILPYLYEVKENDNFWIAFTAGRSYRITASTLKFGPYAKIRNFCNLEDGIINGKSMFISLTGVLSPDTHSFKCKVSVFKDLSFNIFTDSDSTTV